MAAGRVRAAQVLLLSCFVCVVPARLRAETDVCAQAFQVYETCTASAEAGDCQRTLSDCSDAARYLTPCIDRGLNETQDAFHLAGGTGVDWARVFIWTYIGNRAEVLRIGGAAAAHLGDADRAKIMMYHAYQDYVWLRDGNPPAVGTLPDEGDTLKNVGAKHAKSIYDSFVQYYGTPP